MAQPIGDESVQTETVQTEKGKKTMHKHTKKTTAAKSAKKTTAKKTTAAKSAAPQSKAQVILAMLAKGATRVEIVKAIGWQDKSVRGFVSTLRLKGVQVVDTWTKDGARHWKLAKGEYARIKGGK